MKESFKLVDKKGNTVEIGDTITDFRGKVSKLAAVYPLSGKNGHVKSDKAISHHYPSVYDLKFVKIGE